MAGRSIEDTSIAFIGAGNLATNLAKALYRKGFRIVQVYSRTKESAQELAQTVEAAYTTELQAVTKEAQLYIVSLKDAAFVELLPPCLIPISGPTRLLSSMFCVFFLKKKNKKLHDKNTHT